MCVSVRARACVCECGFWYFNSQLFKDFKIVLIISLQSAEEMDPYSSALVFIEDKETMDDFLSLQMEEVDSSRRQEESFTSPLDSEWVTNPNQFFFTILRITFVLYDLIFFIVVWFVLVVELHYYFFDLGGGVDLTLLFSWLL